jgi:NAD(P)-dependent dehydrogenase (short-subunit alcohol dehydrogenase family)
MRAMDLGIEGKVALVTAASKGLGRGTALALSRDGARVTICARSRWPQRPRSCPAKSWRSRRT